MRESLERDCNWIAPKCQINEIASLRFSALSLSPLHFYMHRFRRSIAEGDKASFSFLVSSFCAS